MSAELIIAEAIPLLVHLILDRSKAAGMTEEQVIEAFKEEVAKVKAKDPTLLPDV